MSKLNALVKVAISFGDTRRMLLRVGNLGVKVERNLPNYVKKNTPTSAFSPFTKKIYIPRKKDIDPKEWRFEKIFDDIMLKMNCEKVPLSYMQKRFPKEFGPKKAKSEAKNKK